MADDPPEAARYTLSAARSEQIFQDHIAPLLVGGEPQERPVVVVLTAQPGAGKTTLMATMRERFASSGAAVSIDIGLVTPFHPDYGNLIIDGLLRNDLIMTDARRWLARSLDYLAESRVNVIAEHGLSTPEATETVLGPFSKAGYRIEAGLMGTPAAWSRLGILERYQVAYERTGFGRSYPEERHDWRYARLAETADWLDYDPRISSIAVYRRGLAEPVFSKDRDPHGAWPAAPAARDALGTERSRPWSLEESRSFLQSHASLTARMAPEFSGPLHGARAAAEPLLDPAAVQSIDPPVGMPELPSEATDAKALRLLSMLREGSSTARTSEPGLGH